MTTIKTNLIEATDFSTEITSSSTTGAETLSNVPPAANVTVTVNQDCVNTYTDAMATLSRYQAAAGKDALCIEGLAESMQALDQDMAENINITGQ
jgi:type VII secretion effector (TIGR04197 family)